jgi:hypothetical protein
MEHMFKIKVSHLFPHHIWRQMDILETRNYFWTLMDIIIVNSIRTVMVEWTMTTSHAMMMVV